MVKQPNIPDNTYYQTVNNIALKKNESNKQFIFDAAVQRAAGLGKIISATGGALSAYAVVGKTPVLVLDFASNLYFTDSSSSTLAAATTHSRASNATMVDSDGLLKWAPHNLLTYSEEKPPSGWAFSDGTNTTVVELANGLGGVQFVGTGASNCRMREILTFPSPGNYTLAAYVDPASTYTGIALRVGGLTGASGDTNASASEADGNGLISCTFTVDAADLIAAVDLGALTVTSNTLILGGWHIFRSDLGGMVNTANGDKYVPTTDSAVLPVRQNLNPGTNYGAPGTGVVQWAPHNWTVKSEDISDSNWGLDNGSVSGTDLFTADTSSGFHFFKQTTAGNGVVHPFTYDLEVKPNGYNFLRLFNSIIGVGIDLDIPNRTFSNKSSEFADPVFSSAADGFTRVSVRYIGSRSLAAWSLQPMPSALGTSNFTGDGVSGMRFRKLHNYRSDLGGMVNNPATSDSYVPTTDAAVYLPRTGHHIYNGTAWVNEGLLLESEARTNLIEYSNDFSANGWSKSSTIMGAAISPDSTNNATSALSDTVNETEHRIRRDTELGATTTYTASIFVKNKGANFAGIRALSVPGSNTQQLAFFNLSNGTKGALGSALDSSAIEDVGGGFYRISATFTTTSNIASDLLDFVYTSSETLVDSVEVGDGVIFYGGQLEVGSTPSSYIPTSGAAATRAVETLVVPAANMPKYMDNVTYIGPELVTNGTFDTDTTGWTNSTATIAAVSGSLVVSSQTANPSTTFQSLGMLVVGKVYAISATSSMSGTGGNVARASFYGSTFASSSTATPVTETIVVYATTTSATISFFSFGTADTVATFDNISVREINPLAVSIAVEGKMTYADDGTNNTVLPVNWTKDGSNRINIVAADTLSSRTGDVEFLQEADGVVTLLRQSDAYSPGINVPFNIASRHGSTFVNGATDGTAVTADTTITAIPDLSETEFGLGHFFMGTISELRVWPVDITDIGIAAASAPSLEPSLSLTFSGGTTSFTVSDWSE